MKKANRYSDELKEKIIRECQEIGNVAVVARRYGISSNTIQHGSRGTENAALQKRLKRVDLKISIPWQNS